MTQLWPGQAAEDPPLRFAGLYTRWHPASSRGDPWGRPMPEESQPNDGDTPPVRDIAGWLRGDDLPYFDEESWVRAEQLNCAIDAIKELRQSVHELTEQLEAALRLLRPRHEAQSRTYRFVPRALVMSRPRHPVYPWKVFLGEEDVTCDCTLADLQGGVLEAASGNTLVPLKSGLGLIRYSHLGVVVDTPAQVVVRQFDLGQMTQTSVVPVADQGSGQLASNGGGGRRQKYFHVRDPVLPPIEFARPENRARRQVLPPDLVRNDLDQPFSMVVVLVLCPERRGATGAGTEVTVEMTGAGCELYSPDGRIDTTTSDNCYQEFVIVWRGPADRVVFIGPPILGILPMRFEGGGR